MQTINTTYESSFRERGSKFMGYLFSAESEEVFQAELVQIRSEYPDATHHCWAWRLDPAQPKEFSSDDGEPSGTAGLPILNQLKSFEVVNAGIVVVRYYGGTKLGRSGLIEAYGRSAELCLNKAELMKIKPVQLFEIVYPYSEENTIQKFINNLNLSVTESDYTEKVKLTVACPKENRKRFKNTFSGMEHLDIHFKTKQEHYIRV